MRKPGAFLPTLPPVALAAASAFGLLVLLIAATGWYSYAKIASLSQEVADTRSALASTTALLESNISDTKHTLTSALAAESQNVATVKEQLGGVQTQVSSVTGTVTNLQKLSQLDPQLLAKYSKVYFLNENYAPARLVDIPAANVYFSNKTLQIMPEVWTFLGNMLNQAKANGIPLYVYSAYRSFGTQTALKKEYDVVYGAGTANQFSADQGYSEHQLGTTVDFETTGLGGHLVQGFDQTTAYQWLVDNAYRYGFILSYPKGNDYYVYEPWHWRFVGVKLATYLRNSSQHFYDLDQRTIDSYLIDIFDGS